MRALIIILIIVVLLYLGYREGKKAIDKIEFGDPKFVGADFASIVNRAEFTAIDLQTTITNKNNFDIPVNNLFISVSYQGNLIGKSTNPEPSFIIPKNGYVTISHNMTISLPNSLGIAAKILAKQPIVFEYNVKATLFNFIPLNFNSTFTY